MVISVVGWSCATECRSGEGAGTWAEVPERAADPRLAARAAGTIVPACHPEASAEGSPTARRADGDPSLRSGRQSLRRSAAEPGLARQHDQARAVLDLELGVEVRDLVAHGLVRHGEARGALRVVEALRDQLDEFPLARGERGEGSRRGTVGEEGEHLAEPAPPLRLP